MALDSMYQLLVNQLQDMYHAENQLLKALPKLTRVVRTPALRMAFESHLTQTEDQVSRLEQVFAELGVAPRGRHCKGMEGLLEEGKDLMEVEGSEAVIDAGIISAAQRSCWASSIAVEEVNSVAVAAGYGRSLAR